MTVWLVPMENGCGIVIVDDVGVNQEDDMIGIWLKKRVSQDWLFYDICFLSLLAVSYKFVGVSDLFDANFHLDGHADYLNRSHRVILCMKGKIQAGFEQLKILAIGRKISL